MSITLQELASRYARAAAAAESPQLDRKMRTFAIAGAGMVKRKIQQMHAVDTGTMLNSTTVEKAGDNTWLIGPTVDYAVYVARGTRRRAARPFDLAAADQMRASISAFGFDASDLGI